MEDKHYSKLMLEQIVAGELEIPESAVGDELLMRKIEELRASNREILEAYPPDSVVAEIERRLAGDDSSQDDEIEDDSSRTGDSVTPFRRPGIRGYTLLAAAVVIALAGIVPRLIDRSGAEAMGPIRIKGLEPSITIYRQSGESVERLRDRSAVSEGDLLQISYVSAQQRYGAILSIDGRGVVTVHLPDPRYANGAAELESGGEVALDFAYRLDDAPAFERFFFLTSDSVFRIKEVVDAARALASAGGIDGELDIPKHIDQYSVALIKEKSR